MIQLLAETCLNGLKALLMWGGFVLSIIYAFAFLLWVVGFTITLAGKAVTFGRKAIRRVDRAFLNLTEGLNGLQAMVIEVLGAILIVVVLLLGLFVVGNASGPTPQTWGLPQIGASVMVVMFALGLLAEVFPKQQSKKRQGFSVSPVCPTHNLEMEQNIVPVGYPNSGMKVWACPRFDECGTWEVIKWE